MATAPIRINIANAGAVSCAAVLLVASGCNQANAQSPHQPSPTAAPVVDPKTTADIKDAEKEMVAAIGKRDSKTLERLLADDYVSLAEGSNWAISKKGALARCMLGKLTAYRLDRDVKFTRMGSGIALEGDARVIPAGESDDEHEQRLHLRHGWIKRDGRWQLLQQILPKESEAAAEREREPQRKD